MHQEQSFNGMLRKIRGISKKQKRLIFLCNTNSKRDVSVQWSGYFRLLKLNKQAGKRISLKKRSCTVTKSRRLDSIGLWQRRPTSRATTELLIATLHQDTGLCDNSRYYSSCIISLVIWSSSRLAQCRVWAGAESDASSRVLKWHWI